MERNQAAAKTNSRSFESSIKLHPSSSEFHHYINTKKLINNIPFSQQGLKSFQALHCMGSGPERKRYYISKIKIQMQKIREEIHNMLKTISKNKIYSGCLAHTRTIAKQRAQAYTNYEKELNVLNIVLEINLICMSESEILKDISNIKAKNATLSVKLDDLSTIKMRAENLKNKIEEEFTQYTQNILERCSSEERQEHDNLLKENEKYLYTIVNHKRKISIFKQDIVKLQEIVENNFLKLQRRKLLSKLDEVYREKTEAQKIHEEFSLDSIRNVKRDVNALAKVKVNLDENLKLKMEEYEDICSVIKTNSDSLKNYCKSDQQAKDYSGKFDHLVGNLLAKIKNKELEIAKALDYLAGDALESQQPELDANLLSPLEHHKTLIARMSKLATSKDKYDNEICCVRRELSEVKRRSEAFFDANTEDGKLKEQIGFLEEKQKALKASLADVSSGVKHAMERLEKIQEILCDNELYIELRPLIAEAEKFEKENGILKNAIENTLGAHENNSKSMLQEIDYLVKENNEKIIVKLKQRKIV